MYKSNTVVWRKLLIIFVQFITKQYFSSAFTKKKESSVKAAMINSDTVCDMNVLMLHKADVHYAGNSHIKACGVSKYLPTLEITRGPLRSTVNMFIFSPITPFLLHTERFMWWR